MLIYFDESYDNEHRYLILGALFNPHPKFLLRNIIRNIIFGIGSRAVVIIIKKPLFKTEVF